MTNATPQSALSSVISSETAEQALCKAAQKAFERLSKGRYAEERQWLLASLFDQNKQWLTWDESGKRYKEIPQSTDKPTPMPVSNYFSKAINANANSLGATIPKVICQAHDTSAPNKRAAEVAEIACEELDRETRMEILNPVLAKRTVLWGMGITKEVVKRKASMMPQIEASEPQPQEGVTPEGEPLLDPQMANSLAVVTGELRTELPTPFQVYVSRKCNAANESSEVLEIARVPKQKAVATYGDKASTLKAEEGGGMAQTANEQIRSATSTSSVKASEQDQVTLAEYWADWDDLEKEAQDALTSEWGQQPSVSCQGMSRLQAAQEYGVYVICGKGEDSALDFGENPWEGFKPHTFFVWQMDSGNPYPKGLSQELIPLQKQLNRLDSLMELACMTNAAGKWIMPLTQKGVSQISGNPADFIWFDPQGDGKLKPEFVQPNPYAAALVQKRQQILNDIAEIGLTNGVDTGDSPDGVKSFRGIAFLGAKADEARQTQRFLMEQAHVLRKRKLLVMAKKVWDEPRKAQVAGFNNQFGMMELTGSDLCGDYSVEVINDSSRPKTLSDKMQAIQTLVMGGLLNPQDTQVQDYLFESLNVTELNPSDYLQRKKAERDLEKLKQGQTPVESPFEKPDLTLKVLGEYTLTEEFEALDPNLQQGIVAYAQYISDKLTGIKQTLGGMNPAQPSPAEMLGNAIGAAQGGNALSGVPGQGVSAQQAEGAAAKEGDSVAKQVSPA